MSIKNKIQYKKNKINLCINEVYIVYSIALKMQ